MQHRLCDNACGVQKDAMWGKLRALRDFHNANEDQGESMEPCMGRAGILSIAMLAAVLSQTQHTPTVCMHGR